ncbi:4300_t:CDS:2 [Scutellospora calospora]|uniref:4300_t:CDS:1 n=1 Tax=Scutellospora calospora TaxID=85575 RepID=A0ACA9K568_9GLOM|nr:4300_t:CDS:2 [Scutellospora calospora]
MPSTRSLNFKIRLLGFHSESELEDDKSDEESQMKPKELEGVIKSDIDYVEELCSDDGLDFGFEGPLLRFPAQINDITVLKQTLEALFL